MNAEAHTIEVTAENFQAEVAEKSQQTPVMLEFYAQGADQGVETSVLVARLVTEYQGKFILGRVDIQENQQLVQQLGVRTLPTLKIIFQGQIVKEVEGPVDEKDLREGLDKITLSPMERVGEQIDLLVAQGDRPRAIEMLQQVIAEEPKNYSMHVELCDLLIMEGKADEAQQILVALPADTAGIEKPKNRLAFIEQARELAALDALQLKVDADPESLQDRFELAIRLIVDDRVEAALDELLTILKKDKVWEEEQARKTMIKVFDMLGKGDELATSYRRKMFTFLH